MAGGHPELRRFELHPVLRAGMAAAKPSPWPAPPFHSGGPPPRLTPVELVRFALWCAEGLAGTVPENERSRFDDVIGLVRAYLKNPVVGRNRTAEQGSRAVALKAELAPVATPNEREPIGLTSARRAARAAVMLCSLENSHRSDWAVTEMVGSVVEWLCRSSSGPTQANPVREFLGALDRELCRLECEGAVMRRFKKPPPIRSVPWRAGDFYGRTLWWIARFEDRSYGLLGRLGEQWSWVTGPRDDVLASVPDTLFAQATNALVEAERQDASAE